MSNKNIPTNTRKHLSRKKMHSSFEKKDKGNGNFVIVDDAGNYLCPNNTMTSLKDAKRFKDKKEANKYIKFHKIENVKIKIIN